MDFLRDFVARRINGIANLIAPDPLKRQRDKQMKEIRKVLDEMDWDVVILPREKFYEQTGYNDPLKKSKPGKKMSIDELPEQGFKLDPRSRKLLEDMGIEDFYFEDSYYDDDEPLVGTGISNIPGNFIRKPGPDAKFIDTPSGPLSIETDATGAPDRLDSVFNFAIIYAYGSKKNNVITYYSVDAEGRLYVHDQQQFSITNYRDVIELCDEAIENHDLDRIVFINTDVAKRMVNYVKKGIHKEPFSIEIAREAIDYDASLQKIIPLMGIGKVFVGMGPWLEILQQQLMTHMSAPITKRGTMGNGFSRLKAFINGVKYWEDGVEDEIFVRDYGTIEENNTNAKEKDR